ncbi:hypothetical protein THAOC_26802, partial [Thalassiosira oceanica]
RSANRYNPGSPIAASAARLNRLVLLSLMSYTLKDAADRDRLGGSTFIKLNFLSAVGFAINAIYNSGGLVTPLGSDPGLLCGILFIQRIG